MVMQYQGMFDDDLDYEDYLRELEDLEMEGEEEDALFADEEDEDLFPEVTPFELEPGEGGGGGGGEGEGEGEGGGDDPLSRALDRLRGMGETPTRTARPKRPTSDDAADSLALRAGYGSYYASSTAERAAIRRALSAADKLSFAAHGKGYRDLSPDQQDLISRQVSIEVLPEDDPSWSKLQTALRSDQLRAENLKLYDQRRAALWARQDQLRKEREDQKRESSLLSSLTRQPSPLRAPARPSFPSLSWPLISATLPPQTIASLISSWRGGSLGLGAISSTQLARLMAFLPLASDATAFLTLLRALWLKSGAPSSGSSGSSSPRSSIPIPSSRRSSTPFPSPTRIRTPSRLLSSPPDLS